MDYKLSYFINLFDYQGNFITDTIKSLRYKLSELEDDVCEIEIQSGDPQIANHRSFAEGKSLTVQWGWINGTKSNVRKIYVFDRETHYKEDAIIELKLICHEKFAIGKMDSTTNKNLTQLKSGSPIIFSTQAIQNINIELGKGNTQLKNFLNQAGLLNAGTPSAFNKHNVIVATYNGNMSTYYTLRSFLDKLPGGPYVMDSRDDKLTIRTRDFHQKSTKTFTWRGGTGELESFIPISKNRSRKSSTDKVTVATYDPKTKTATSASASPNNTLTPFYAGSNGGVQAKLSQDLSLRIDLPSLEQQKLNKIGLTQKALPGSLPNKAPVTRDSSVDNLVSQIKKNETNKSSHPYNDFNKNVVDKAFIVSKGNVNGPNSPIVKQLIIAEVTGYKTHNALNPNTGKLFNSGANGIQSQTTANRDNTAYVHNNFALIQIQETLGKNIHTNDTSENAAALASNQQKEAELENNPGSCHLIGQPEIECGQLITILGVAKMHSGNYYIQECEHVLDDSTYKLDIGKLVRDGVNRNNPTKSKKKKGIDLASLIPNNPNLQKHTTIINTSVGPEASNLQKTKTITSKSPNKS